MQSRFLVVESEAYARAELACVRLDQWRSHLTQLSTDSLRDIREQSFLGRELRAAAVVAVMAELEALLRDMIVSICAHVNSANVQTAFLVPSLRPLAAFGQFESESNTSSHDARWEGRFKVTAMEHSQEVARLPGPSRRAPQPPLDGRTIQARHISLVWKVLGIHSNPIPRASTATSLKKLTQIRNDVAHRNLEISQVFSEAGRTAADIAAYIDDVVLLALNIGNEWGSYVAGEAYILAKQA